MSETTLAQYAIDHMSADELRRTLQGFAADFPAVKRRLAGIGAERQNQPTPYETIREMVKEAVYNSIIERKKSDLLDDEALGKALGDLVPRPATKVNFTHVQAAYAISEEMYEIMGWCGHNDDYYDGLARIADAIDLLTDYLAADFVPDAFRRRVFTGYFNQLREELIPDLEGDRSFADLFLASVPDEAAREEALAFLANIPKKLLAKTSKYRLPYVEDLREKLKHRDLQEEAEMDEDLADDALGGMF